ncbi:MAG TPA: hypothetical protein VGJ60_13245 [Chloroflexota bacterium]|jgi:hypothetical protein
MSTTTNQVDAPLFSVRNHHSAACGRPPNIDDRGPSHYLGYFENQHGEQAVLVYDRDTRQAIVYLGDAGWDAPHVVVDGAVPDLVLSETERLWVRACWQAATANAKEM